MAKVRVKFKGLIFVPDGDRPKLNLKEMLIPQTNTQELFVEFKRSIKEGNFKIEMEVGSSPNIPPVTVMYQRVGQTAGLIALTIEENDKLKHMHGFTALLSKLDADDDKQAIDTIRNYASLKGIAPDMFDVPLREPEPVAATFFCDIGSANYPVLFPIIKLASGAFFDQFGILDGDESPSAG